MAEGTRQRPSMRDRFHVHNQEKFDDDDGGDGDGI